MFGRTNHTHGERHRPTFFSIIGAVVVVVVLIVVAYFAWVGWQSRGRPVPDLDIVKDQPATPTPTQPQGQ